jgi:glucosyl-3-phosphoglycerate synthase
MAETLSSPALWQPWPVSRAQVACVIPAKDEQERIAATVTAARELPHVSLVLVCDDGSSDQTAQFAAGAGAIVVSHNRNRGKSAAIESAVNALGVLEQRDDRPESGTLLLLDADLEDSAANCGPLIEPVVSGRADLTIGVLPPQRTAAGEAPGGLGLVMTTATRGIQELTGWTPRAPLSGQRCITRRAFEVASPLAAGWGVEVGMTIDVLRAGLKVEEIEIELHHRATGSDFGSHLHRAKQLRDVTRALAARGLVQAGIQELKDSGGVQGLLRRLKR